MNKILLIDTAIHKLHELMLDWDFVALYEALDRVWAEVETLGCDQPTLFYWDRKNQQWRKHEN